MSQPVLTKMMVDMAPAQGNTFQQIPVIEQVDVIPGVTTGSTGDTSARQGKKSSSFADKVTKVVKGVGAAVWIAGTILKEVDTFHVKKDEGSAIYNGSGSTGPGTSGAGGFAKLPKPVDNSVPAGMAVGTDDVQILGSSVHSQELQEALALAENQEVLVLEPKEGFGVAPVPTEINLKEVPGVRYQKYVPSAVPTTAPTPHELNVPVLRTIDELMSSHRELQEQDFVSYNGMAYVRWPNAISWENLSRSQLEQSMEDLRSIVDGQIASLSGAARNSEASVKRSMYWRMEGAILLYEQLPKGVDALRFSLGAAESFYLEHPELNLPHIFRDDGVRITDSMTYSPAEPAPQPTQRWQAPWPTRTPTDAPTFNPIDKPRYKHNKQVLKNMLTIFREVYKISKNTEKPESLSRWANPKYIERHLRKYTKDIVKGDPYMCKYQYIHNCTKAERQEADDKYMQSLLPGTLVYLKNMIEVWDYPVDARLVEAIQQYVPYRNAERFVIENIRRLAEAQNNGPEYVPAQEDELFIAQLESGRRRVQSKSEKNHSRKEPKQTGKEAKKARKKAKKARRKARKEAKHARKEAEQARTEARNAVRHINDTLSSLTHLLESELM